MPIYGVALILALLDEESYLLEGGSTDSGFRKDEKRSWVLSNRASRCSDHPSTPQANSPTRRRGKMSLLIRRDATLRISGALSRLWREAFLSSLKKSYFFSRL